ncbi:MAG: PEP-CTERM sorting domain-containing protein [Coleofasciculus sp. A1-SPW-01]|uniref:PEP-CTERM sorting domain-containing protein n=1 Tax=Coleofasciculus sp. A1-SPW-01 TaxID=3070819 RepID=UPI00330439DB
MKCFSSIATVGTTLVALGTVMVCSNGALADPLNDRPKPEIPTGTSLQTILDDITVSGPGINVVNNQSKFALFDNTSASGAIGTFVAEIAGFAPENQFGLYSANNPNNKALIFDGPSKPFDQAFITFFDNGDIKVNNDLVATGFGDSFGFYLHTPENNTFYTEDSLNNGNPQALVYQGDNVTELKLDGLDSGTFVDTEFIFAFEDKLFSSTDKDYNDSVVHLSGIKPAAVPEPMTILGSALALGFGGLFKRERSKRQKN